MLDTNPTVALDDPIMQKIIDILDRREDIPALEALAAAVKGSNVAVNLVSSAIAIDTNVLLRISSHPKSSDIMDYLTGLHQKPLIVPGQAIQEFWNNQLSVTDTLYKIISRKHLEMSKEIEKYKAAGITTTESISVAISDFKARNEHVFDPELIAKTSGFLERLSEKATVPFFPRSALLDIAVHRKRSKTPPGFKDEGDGDFYVWADILWGLSKAQTDGEVFDSVIVLSNDAKIDWSRGSTPHPILSAEITALLNTRLVIWNLDQFATAIGQSNTSG